MEKYQICYEDKTIYPMGLTILNDGIHLSVYSKARNCTLVLFQGEEDQPFLKIPFPEELRIGDLFQMTLKSSSFLELLYCFESEEKLFSDPYGVYFFNCPSWGDLTQDKYVLKSIIREETFEWGGDRPLNRPYEEAIIYRAHVRGFTKHRTAGVKDRGTFQGMIDKIPYLKELGITTLELLPVYEFQEVIFPDSVEGNPYGVDKPTGKLNYWGYSPGLYFAAKSAYASAVSSSPAAAFKSLVKALHQAGIELIVELYFNGTEPPGFVLDTARYWIREFHLDGIHFVGNVPLELLGSDPYLSDSKLWADGWGEIARDQRRTPLGIYRNDFMMAMRKLLKGDEDQLQGLIYFTKQKEPGRGVINYLSHTNGFTLADMVTYDRKHNEANGEDNQDGNDYNYSWNCGAEGNTRKKKIIELRKKQLRNAIVLLMISQGTPMILAGDEFGNSQKGNNNAYCQDNEISWLNWKELDKNRDLFEFTKFMIRFRKAHPVFSQPEQLRVMDYLSCGYPDVSYHGVKAWYPQFENFRRELGMMYCGRYVTKKDGTNDDSFYVIVNMHWEAHQFDLPHLPKNQQWYLVVNTNQNLTNGCDQDGAGQPVSPEKNLLVPPRTVLILIGK